MVGCIGTHFPVCESMPSLLPHLKSVAAVHESRVGHAPWWTAVSPAACQSGASELHRLWHSIANAAACQADQHCRKLHIHIGSGLALDNWPHTSPFLTGCVGDTVRSPSPMGMDTLSLELIQCAAVVCHVVALWCWCRM
jgi:hypothetical protein